MKKILLLAMALTSMAAMFAQTTLTLTFKGRDQHNARVQLDNVTIQNVTRGWTEAIFFPDTVYTLTVGTGVADYLLHGGMQVMPNPFDGRTQVNINSTKSEKAFVTVVDINGKKCAEYSGILSGGDNYFEIELTTPQTYILSVQTADGVRSLKMVNMGSAGVNQIKEAGMNGNAVQLKSTTAHIFELGDEMRYTGYSQQSNGLIPSTPITQNQYDNETITLFFMLDNDAELPIVATVAASNIGMNTATTGGNVFSDGGATVTARGVCYSVTPNPTLAESHTADGTGTGAFTSSLTNLVENTTYYVRAYATNSAGTAYGNEVSFTTEAGSSLGNTCPGVPTVTDYDGNIYNTVLIGTQCWMRENLRTTHYANGTPIQEGYVNNGNYNEDYDDCNIAYRYLPNDNGMTVPTYGYLYNYVALMHGKLSSNANPSGVQGVCPTGWHVPSYAETVEMLDYVKYQPENQCNGNLNYIAKSLASNSGWYNEDDEGICVVGYQPSTTNNATGFSAMPAGAYPGDENYFGWVAVIWTTTADNYQSQWNIEYDEPDVSWYHWGSVGSVRCVKDPENSTPSTAEVMTLRVSDGQTVATCEGEIVSNGGSAIISRGFCWSTSENPTIADNHTTDGTGMGIYTSTINNLTVGTRYYVRAYATNSVGTSYGNQIAVMIHPGCPNAPTVIDIDNNIYQTIRIGHQCWMKENLRTTRYANGDSIALNNGRFYPIDENSVSVYGYLYNWNATMHGANISNANPSRIQGVCPDGWHVPSKSEWLELIDTIRSRSEFLCGGDTANITKALSSAFGWTYSSGDCSVGHDQGYNNLSGFTALPANYGRSTFWSTTAEYYDYDYYSYYVFNILNWGAYSNNVTWNSSYNRSSVRCVRDTVFLPLITTNAVTFATNTAVCGGNVMADGGADVTVRGVCWSTSQNPTINDNHTTDGNGLGNFISSITGLSAGTTYYVRAYAVNSSGTAYGEQHSFTTTTVVYPCSGMVTMTDYDGNVYNTEQIGTQCWMKENLRTTHYADGTSIPLGDITSTTTGYRYYPSSNSSNVPTYGYLYNWKAVMGNSSSSSLNPSGVQGICPTGWHVPSDAEWNQLETYLRSQSQYLCNNYFNTIAKALASTTGWDSSSTSCAVGNNPSANNATGFSAFPVGYVYGPYTFGYDGKSTNFWSSFEISSDYACCRSLKHDMALLSTFNTNKGSGYSVRCLLNESVLTEPSVTTLSVSYFTQSTAQCGGIVTSDGGASIVERGICWGTDTNLTVSGNHIATNYAATGTFVVNITGLTPGTTYYLRAYATNSEGTGYGDVVSFTTLAILDPSATTSPAINITATTATLNGNISNPDNVTITAQGFEWKQTAATDYTVVNVTGSTMFHALTGLTANTSYTYRAFVSTADTTVYGDELSFVTLASPIAPTVTTTPATNISQTGATLHGSIYNPDNVGISAQGFEWKLSTANDYTTVNVSGETMTYNLTNLISDTQYTYRAFLTTTTGTSYGDERTFTTSLVTIVFSEDFSQITDSNSYAIAYSLDNYTHVPGWTGNWVYPSTGKVRVGKSAEAGFIQTPEIDLSANSGQFVLSFDAKAWNNDATSLIVAVNEVPYTVSGLSSSTFNTFSVPFNSGTSSTVIKFQGFQDSRSRFFLDNVVVSSGLMVDTVPPFISNSVALSDNTIEITFNEALDSIMAQTVANYVFSNNITVTSATLNSDKVTLTLSPSLIEGYPYSLIVRNVSDVAGNIMASDTISVTYGVGAEFQVPNIAALRAKWTSPLDVSSYQIGDVVYKLTGDVVVTGVNNSHRHQIYIQDATGAIVIDDPNNQITTMLEIGDKISGIYGTLTDYYGQLQFSVSQECNVPLISIFNDVTPLTVTLAEMQDIDYMNIHQCELIRMEGVLFNETGNFTNGHKYTLSQNGITGTGVWIRFYNEYGLTGAAIPTTATTITGVNEISYGQYYLIPRRGYDISNSSSQYLTGNDVSLSQDHGTGLMSVTLQNNTFHVNKMSVFDINGNFLFEQSVDDDNQIKVDVQQLSVGSYFLRLSDGKHSITKEFEKR